MHGHHPRIFRNEFVERLWVQEQQDEADDMRNFDRRLTPNKFKMSRTIQGEQVQHQVDSLQKGAKANNAQWNRERREEHLNKEKNTWEGAGEGRKKGSIS